jgi:FkbM family methyltransferase
MWSGPMTIRGQIVNMVCRLTVQSPFAGRAESLLRMAGRRHPTSRTVQSFARHFGNSVMRREGAAFERIVTFDSGGKMRCGPEDKVGLLALQHYFLGTITGQMEDERPIVRFLERAVRKGDTFFDVGSNLGFYSLYVGPMCERAGQIHAFEPNPTLIDPLKKSIELNRAQSNIRLNEVAVGRESGKVLPLFGPSSIGCSSFHAHGWLDKSSFVNVPVIALDDYVRSNAITKIDGMKIDIEGAEMEAFEGMHQIFEHCPPRFVICELMPDGVASRAESAARPTEIISFMERKGYMACLLGPDGVLQVPPLTGAAVESSPHIVNVIFAHQQLRRDRPELFSDA